MKKIFGSRKWTAYVLTLCSLVGMTALRAPPDVMAYVGQAIMLGLPVLLGGQAYVDSRQVVAEAAEAKP